MCLIFCFAYQFITAHRRERLNKKALLVWAPTENISESKRNIEDNLS